MAMRQVETDILIEDSTTEDPYHIKTTAINKLAIMNYKINQSDNSHIINKLTYNTVKIHMLENEDINKIKTTDLVVNKHYNDISRYTDYDKYLTLFIANKVGILLNISFDDFLKKNIIEIDSIIRVCTIMNKTTSIANNTILEKELEALGLGGKGLG